jgi:CBS domain-containing protein
MKVRDIMTKPVVSCQTSEDLATAARLMLQGGFGAMPVIDAHGTVAGVLTDRDIALAAGTRQRNAAHIAVHEAMTSKVRSCFAGDEVSAALRQMEEAHVRRLPVLDESSHLAGILSIDDIAARGLDQADGISSADFVRAFRRIAAPSTPGEPEMSASDTYVSG